MGATMEVRPQMVAFRSHPRIGVLEDPARVAESIPSNQGLPKAGLADPHFGPHRGPKT